MYKSRSLLLIFTEEIEKSTHRFQNQCFASRDKPAELSKLVYTSGKHFCTLSHLYSCIRISHATINENEVDIFYLELFVSRKTLNMCRDNFLLMKLSLIRIIQSKRTRGRLLKTAYFS